VNPQILAEEFVEQLRILCDAGSPSGPVLVGGKATVDGTAVVVYKESAQAPLLGRTYRMNAYSRLFSPDSSAAYLAGVAFADDLCDPSGGGQPVDVDWAEGLVSDPGTVGWILSDEEKRELDRQGRLR
jgi:hypothetical protein